MKFLLKFAFLLGIPSVFGSVVKVTVKNLTVEYVDGKYLDLKTGVDKINEVSAINVMMKFKTDIPENLTMYAKAMKWLIDDYRIQIFQIRKSCKDALDMETFDLQTAFLDYTRPPAVWPIQKGVIYRLRGWIPNATKFPQNIPDGKWKVELTARFLSKNPIFILNWFGLIE